MFTIEQKMSSFKLTFWLNYGIELNLRRFLYHVGSDWTHQIWSMNIENVHKMPDDEDRMTRRAEETLR